ncbi:hypothetical protein FGB62_181g022 [Gracilaria domingensis]|nr:hypothetical protein FGB62_181g022 [Gracilaria domingensis]
MRAKYVNLMDKGAEAGQAWNPDVDWMRFDVQQELRKKNEEAEKAARESWRQQRSFNEEQIQEQRRISWILILCRGSCAIATCKAGRTVRAGLVPRVRWGSDLSSLSETPSDWGARLGKKTSSERSAWQAWESASGREDTTTRQGRWKLRKDTAQHSRPKKSSAFMSDIDRWRDMAQQVASGGARQPDAPSESISGSKKARLADDSAINSWKSAARDLAIETSSEEEE